MVMFIDFWTRLFQTNMIIGMCVAIIGVALIFLSKTMVKAYKKVETVDKNDKALLILRGFGLLFILIAMFIMILY